MTHEDAAQTIFKHAGAPQPNGSYTGLLSRLRPYAGLQESDFLELLQALVQLSNSLRSQSVPRELMAALWEICRTLRFWSKASNQLQHRSAMPIAAQARLELWVDELERIILELLQGENSWWAFLNTASFSLQMGYNERAGFLVPLWVEALDALMADTPDPADATSPALADLRILCEAIGKAGVGGQPALHTLERLIRQTPHLPLKRTAGRALKAVLGAS